MTLTDTLLQIGVVLPSVLAIWLVNGRSPKWASVFALISEPFWYSEFYTHRQYGMLIVCTLYTVSWARGFKRHWIDKQ